MSRVSGNSYLLGASMRIGALIPRYNLEALRGVSLVSVADARHSTVPFVLDDLPEAVDHAIVCLLAGTLAGLKLSGDI